VSHRGKNMRSLFTKSVSPTVTIHVSGTLSQGHLRYLDQLVASASDCALWPLLDLAHLAELDRNALGYLMGGEGRDFGIVACPNFVREWMQQEKDRCAALSSVESLGLAWRCRYSAPTPGNDSDRLDVTPREREWNCARHLPGPSARVRHSAANPAKY
jgi:hypothetical protein